MLTRHSENSNYNSPVQDVTSTDLRCNTGSFANAANTSVATVSAGSTVGMALDQVDFDAVRGISEG
jgi:hypothetical protein